MKIRALRIEINGELIAVAGAERLSMLVGSVGFGVGSSSDTNLGKVHFSVMGLEAGGPQPRQLMWGNNVQLQLGDKVTFQLVEAEHPSPPSKVLASPNTEELAAAALQGKKRRRSVPMTPSASLQRTPRRRRKLRAVRSRPLSLVR